MSIPRLILPLSLMLALSPAPGKADALLQATVESLRDAEQAVIEGKALASPRLTADFYAARGHALAWESPRQVRGLLDTAQASSADGLIPTDFHLDVLQRFSETGSFDGLTPAARISADLRLSDALLRYIHQIRFGRLDPTEVNKAWNYRKATPSATLIESMQQVLDAGDAATELSAIAPKPYFYTALKGALADVGGAEHLRGLPAIPAGENLALGSRDPRVALIRERLVLLGDEKAGVAPELELFDADLRQSVIAFQRRFGLGSDGVIGPRTLRTLNAPYDSAKTAKIRMNLERMRWFYDRLPEDYVFVDIAGFMVHVIRGEQIHWSTRGVVGKPDAQTPAFRDYMEYLVFNPTWTVPPSIEKKYKGVPEGFKRVKSGGRYYLVQGPGPRNALGRVKFMFPNGHAIYLHDTPSKGLFSHGTRAYSHGCVRVQNPLELAEVLLNKPSWSKAEINRVVSRNRTRDVLLEEHIPVLLYYLTAKVDEKGRLSYRKDVYGRDGRLSRAIDGPPSPLRIAFPKEAPIPLPEPALDAPAEAVEVPVIEAELREAAPELQPEAEPAVGAPSPIEASTSPTLDHPLAANR